MLSSLGHLYTLQWGCGVEGAVFSRELSDRSKIIRELQLVVDIRGDRSLLCQDSVLASWCSLWFLPFPQRCFPCGIVWHLQANICTGSQDSVGSWSHFHWDNSQEMVTNSLAWVPCPSTNASSWPTGHIRIFSLGVRYPCLNPSHSHGGKVQQFPDVFLETLGKEAFLFLVDATGRNSSG